MNIFSRELKHYFQGFLAFARDKFNRVLLLLTVFFVVAASLLYWVAGEKSQDSLAKQMLRKEQLIARAAAKNIEFFFELAGKSLVLLARSSKVASMGEDAQKVLDNFITDWQGTPLVGVILVDKEGVVRFNANIDKRPETGTLVSDRDYFVWAKTAKAGEIFVGKPVVSRLGASKDKYIVTLTSPIFRGESFYGVVTAAILLDELTEIYLEPLKISASTKVYLLDQETLFVYSQIPELTGKSDLFLPQLEEELAQAAKKGEGKLDYLRNDDSQKAKLSRWLLAYSLVDLTKLGRGFWILAVERPFEDTQAFFWPFRVNQMAALILAISLILAFSLLVVIAVKVAKKEAYIHGLKDGKDRGE